MSASGALEATANANMTSFAVRLYALQIFSVSCVYCTIFYFVLNCNL